MTKTTVNVWLDETSQEHGWIVSLDDDKGTDTLRAFDDSENGYDDAVEFAKQYASENSLPLVIDGEKVAQ